jgi:AcrR family transcriptional regulator
MNALVKRVRRSTETVNALILGSARKLFAERGYRASTRDIAKLAGVPEPLLFRKYRSKPRLFEAAVSGALVDFYASFDANHRAGLDDDSKLADRAYLFTRELIQLIRENRQLIFAYLSAREFEPDLGEMPLSDGLKDYFFTAETHLQRRYRLLGIEPSVPPAMTARLAFLTAVGAVLFQGWVFDEEDLTHEDFLESLNRFILRDFPSRARGQKSADGKPGAAGKAEPEA